MFLEATQAEHGQQPSPRPKYGSSIQTSQLTATDRPHLRENSQSPFKVIVLPRHFGVELVPFYQFDIALFRKIRVWEQIIYHLSTNSVLQHKFMVTLETLKQETHLLLFFLGKQSCHLL